MKQGGVAIAQLDIPVHQGSDQEQENQETIQLIEPAYFFWMIWSCLHKKVLGVKLLVFCVRWMMMVTLEIKCPYARGDSGFFWRLRIEQFIPPGY